MKTIKPLTAAAITALALTAIATLTLLTPATPTATAKTHPNPSIAPITPPAPPDNQRGGSSATPHGIWVTGEATISAEPDLALLNLGVESTAQTVSDANAQASTAMDAIREALKDNSIPDKDIQTSRFNIDQIREWQEIDRAGIRTSKSVVTGYRVSNTARVKIRDLDTIGATIDAVVAAAGDHVRINNIRFALENADSRTTELRQAAVADAKAKANQLASLNGAKLGRLLYINEGANPPSPYDHTARSAYGVAFAAQADIPETSISAGNIDLSLTVQAVFAINHR